MNPNDLKFRTPHGPPVELASEECLIDELMKRKRLRVVRVENVVPAALVRGEGTDFQQHMEFSQGKHIGQHISTHAMCQTSITFQPACPEHPEQATFEMWAIVLAPNAEGGH